MKPHVRRALSDIRTRGIDHSLTRERIEELREQLNISQDALAKLSGVSPGLVASVEAGRPVSPEMLTYLKEVMETTVWSEAHGAYLRKVNGQWRSVRRRIPNGSGWRKTGKVIRITDLEAEDGVVPALGSAGLRPEDEIEDPDDAAGQRVAAAVA